MLVDTVVSRGEFLTSYTPYQAEISQGTLTTIFEFQTMICQLTGMDVANASMYDGSTAVPEAAMMAARITGSDRVVVARTLHPEYREVLRTYAKNQGMPVEEFGYDARQRARSTWRTWKRSWTTHTAAVIVQSPNFFGIVEEVKAGGGAGAPARRALLVHVFTEAVSLGLLEPPAKPISWRASCNRSPFRPATAARTPASSRPRRSSCGRCRAAWWARPRTRAATAPSA